MPRIFRGHQENPLSLHDIEALCGAINDRGGYAEITARNSSDTFEMIASPSKKPERVFMLLVLKHDVLNAIVSAGDVTLLVSWFVEWGFNIED